MPGAAISSTENPGIQLAKKRQHAAVQRGLFQLFFTCYHINLPKSIASVMRIRITGSTSRCDPPETQKKDTRRYPPNVCHTELIQDFDIIEVHFTFTECKESESIGSNGHILT